MTLGSPIPVSISAMGTIGNCAKPWTPYSPGWALRNAKPSLCDVKVAAGCFYLRCIAGPYRMQVGSAGDLRNMPALKACAGEFVLRGHAAAIGSCNRGRAVRRTEVVEQIPFPGI